MWFSNLFKIVSVNLVFSLRLPINRNFLQEKKTQLEPLAAKIQEQVKTVAANAQAQFQPMMESLQTQMEDFFQRLTEQARAIAN